MSLSSTWFILGAGAMGTTVCHRLQTAGTSSQLLHHQHVSQERILRASGVKYRLPVLALEQQKPRSIDRLMVTTKAGQLSEALRIAMPFLTETAIVLTLANGMGFERLLAAQSTRLKLFRAVSTAAAYRDAQGEVIPVAVGTTRVGDLRANTKEPHWFSDSLAHLECWSWKSPIAAAVAEKFAVNCAINPLTATLRCRNGELLRDDKAGPALAALCAETEPALRQLGLWDRPQSLAQVATEICIATHNNRSSMLQDVLAGRRTEIEFLNGELLRLAAELPMDLPRNSELLNRLR